MALSGKLMAAKQCKMKKKKHAENIDKYVIFRDAPFIND
jgi:hypothetical protein